MAENGPRKGPEQTLMASRVESEGFRALVVALAGNPEAASGV